MNQQGVLDPGSHSVSVLGVRQAYHIGGSGPFCIVHGGGPGSSWEYMRMPLLEQHMTMIYLEPIGTGNSGHLAGHPHGYGVRRYAEQLRGFLDALDLSDAFILGHSHGGFVAQELAVANTDRLAGLILYSSSAVTGERFMMSADAGVRRFAGAHAGTAVAAEALLGWEAVPTLADDAGYTRAMHRLLPVYLADHRRADFSLDAMRENLRMTYVVGEPGAFDKRADLGSLDLPTLVLAGNHDFICGPEWGDILHQSIPGSQFVRFEDSGHLAHIEQPDAFAEAVAGFVARHRSTAASPFPA